VALLTPAAGEQYVVKEIRVVNTQATSSRTFTIYHDINGTTYNAASQIDKTWTLGTNERYTDKSDIVVDENGSLAWNGSHSDLTITVYGMKKT